MLRPIFFLPFLFFARISGRVSGVHRYAGPEFECLEDRDCPRYHWCEVSHSDPFFGTPKGSKCETNLYRFVSLRWCGRHHDICRRLDMPDNPSSSTAMCFDADGRRACRRSLLMPCALGGGGGRFCADGFECREVESSDGAASACVPGRAYRGGGGHCRRDVDCGYSEVFGHRWMSCVDDVCETRRI